MGVLLLLVISLVAPAPAAQKVEKEGKAWLNLYQEPTEINVNGLWHSPDWGDVILNQEKDKRDITGTGDGWDITGVVSGKKIYLLFSDKGRINYSAELLADGETALAGSYSKGMLSAKSRKRPMRLTRK